MRPARAAAIDRGWFVERIRDEETFARLRIDGPDALLVDLCLDSPPQHPPIITILGPTYTAEELAGRKVVALFSRAEARDFADVHSLGQRFSRSHLVELAAAIDDGFDLGTFATMLDSISRFDDETLATAGAAPADLRAWCAAWADELRDRG